MLSVELSPTSWDDVYFQGPIVKSIRGAIENKRPPKSVALIGSSGRGKTSIAHLLAASIVCPNVKGSNPCGKCDDCQEVFSGTYSRTVWMVNGRIDNSVAYHREIVDTLKGTNLFNSKKVLIIDEFQGLSNEAKEVYLVPQESKQDDGIFYIFGTTEGEKIKESSLSRSHVYHLKSPTVEEICKYLVAVLRHQKIQAPEDFLKDGVFEIANNSGGNLRAAANDLQKVVDSNDFSIENVKALISGESSVSADEFFYQFLANGFKMGTVLIKQLNSLSFSGDITQTFNYLMWKATAAHLCYRYQVQTCSSKDFSAYQAIRDRYVPTKLNSIELGQGCAILFKKFVDTKKQAGYNLDRAMLLDIFMDLK